MIYGIGTDLLVVARIAALHSKYRSRFEQKVLMPQERRALEGLPQPANRIAKSFAAKEAFVKAWGSGFAGVGYQDAGVLRNAEGKPYLIFSPAMQARLDAAGITAAHLSLSDDDGRVLAFVVLEAASAPVK